MQQKGRSISQCAREAAAKCDAFPGCTSFGLSIAYWKGHGVVGKYFTSGRSSYSRDSGWQMWTREHQSERGEDEEQVFKLPVSCRIHELKEELANPKMEKKKEAVKNWIAYIKGMPWDMIGAVFFLSFMVLVPLLCSCFSGRGGEECAEDGSDSNSSSGSDSGEEDDKIFMMNKAMMSHMEAIRAKGSSKQSGRLPLVDSRS